jgi:transposase
LADRLDYINAKWREGSVLLLDNVSLHHHDHVKEVIKKRRLPIMFSGVASFEALPVERVFAKVKQKFNPIYQKKMEKMKFSLRGPEKGEKSKIFLESIDEAV